MSNPSAKARTSRRSTPQRVGYALVATWVASMSIFMVMSHLLGGVALNGKIEAGAFYLGDHGTYTAVSRSLFILSAKAEACLVGSMTPVLFFSFLLLGARKDGAMRNPLFWIVFGGFALIGYEAVTMNAKIISEALKQ